MYIKEITERLALLKRELADLEETLFCGRKYVCN
jgi:hypothetical protein